MHTAPYHRIALAALAGGALTWPGAAPAVGQAASIANHRGATAAVAAAAERIRLPGLLRHYLRLAGGSAAPEPEATEPETGDADPLGLAVVLPGVQETVKRVQALAPTAMLAALQTALGAYDDAHRALHAGSSSDRPDFVVDVLLAVADGQAALVQALDVAAASAPELVALLLPAVHAARDAARHAGSSVVELAERAGVADSRLVQAREAIRTADSLAAAGNYGGAGIEYAGGFGLAAGTLVFDLDRFEQNLRSVFDVSTVGWAYAINQGGQLARSGSGGAARTGADLPALAQLPAKPMHLASATKTLTAIVALRRLAELGIAVDSPIGPWLPLTWPRGAGVNEISFRQLMQHRSGFGQNAPGGSSYAALQAMVAQAVPANGSFDYDNANYGLLRVIVARLLGVDAALLPPQADAAALAAAAFIAYAQAAFGAVGVPFGCDPQPVFPTLQYHFPDTGNPGYDEPSRALSCGGFGAFLSARDLARSLAYLRYTQQLVPGATYQQMKTGSLGYTDPALYGYGQGVFGVYHGHGGDWDHGPGGLDSCHLSVPIHVEAALLINSSPKQSGTGYPNGDHQCWVMRWAFENAWIAN